MDLNGITLETGISSKIQYNYEPVVLYDKTSIDGVKRHIDKLIIDGELQWQESFVFSIADLSTNDETALKAIDGSNSVTFQAYDDQNQYNCNCSVVFSYLSQSGQQVPLATVTLVVRSIIDPIVGGLALAASTSSEHTLHMIDPNGNLTGSHSIGSDIYYNGTSSEDGVQCVFDTVNKNAFFRWSTNASKSYTNILKMDSKGNVSTEIQIYYRGGSGRPPRIALNKDGSKLYCWYLRRTPSSYHLDIIDVATMVIDSSNDSGYPFSSSTLGQRMLVSADSYLYAGNDTPSTPKFNISFSTKYEIPSIIGDMTLEHNTTLPTLYVRTLTAIYKITDNGTSFGTPVSIVSSLSAYRDNNEIIIWNDRIITTDPVSSAVTYIKMYDLTGLPIDTLNLGSINIVSPIAGINIRNDYLYYTAYNSSAGELNIYKSALTLTDIGTPELFINGKGNPTKSQDWLGYNFENITNAT